MMMPSNSVIEDIPQALLAMLDPITIDEVHILLHALHKTDTHIVKNKTKHKMMEANGFVAKVT
jgi:hypothetical protein